MTEWREYIYRERETADGVDGDRMGELVRCKECRHLVRYDGTLVCSEPGGMMKFTPDGFCSYGQRRNEG